MRCVAHAFKLFRIAVDVTVSERDIGVAAAISDGVHPIADSHDCHDVLADLELGGGAIGELGERADTHEGVGRRGHARAPDTVGDAANLAPTFSRKRSGCAAAGSRSITSAKNPNTTSRSAISGRMPRLSK